MFLFVIEICIRLRFSICRQETVLRRENGIRTTRALQLQLQRRPLVGVFGFEAASRNFADFGFERVYDVRAFCLLAGALAGPVASIAAGSAAVAATTSVPVKM